MGRSAGAPTGEWHPRTPTTPNGEWSTVHLDRFHIWRGDDPVEAHRQADEQNKGRGLVGILLRIQLISEHVVGFGLAVVLVWRLVVAVIDLPTPWDLLLDN